MSFKLKKTLLKISVRIYLNKKIEIMNDLHDIHTGQIKINVLFIVHLTLLQIDGLVYNALS